MEEMDTIYIRMSLFIPCLNRQHMSRRWTLRSMNENTLMTAVLVVSWPDIGKDILGDVKKTKWLRGAMTMAPGQDTFQIGLILVIGRNC